jgi:hypothetical protein
MTTKIKVSAEVFAAAKRQATWDGTVTVFMENGVYPILMQNEPVDGNRSYHSESECVIVAGIANEITVIIPE